MRIAFLTPEFVSDYHNGGGLGNYLYRTCKLLVERGHQPEVFVSSVLDPSVENLDGIRVERVSVFGRRLPAKIVGRLLRSSRDDWGVAFSLWSQAAALAKALERRHREAQFDLVQSADYLAVGLAVKKVNGRVHVVRCSTAADLYDNADGAMSRADAMRERLERLTIRRADKAYAPSSYIARHYRDRFGLNVDVMRPPCALEAVPSAEPPCGLPARYIVHFGLLRRRKGTHLVCDAFKIALAEEPSLRLVMVGRGDFGELDSALATLCNDRWKVQVLYPLPKPQLYATVRSADAAVLPSLVDNLPNTVIESLALGTPVIGSRGASIDELVEDGVTGELIEPGDVQALAASMVKVWRGESEVRKGFVWRGGIADEMRPDRAIQRLLQLAGQKNDGAPSGALKTVAKSQADGTK